MRLARQIIRASFGAGAQLRSASQLRTVSKAIQSACGELHVCCYRIVSVDKSAVLWPARVSEFGAGGELQNVIYVYEHREAFFVTNFYTRLRIETAAHVRHVSQATSARQRPT